MLRKPRASGNCRTCEQHSEDGLVCKVEELLDVSIDVAGQEPSAVALERHTIRADEELLEVPGHVVPGNRAPDDALGVVHEGRGLIAGEWEFLLQVHKQGMCVLPVNIHFLKQLKLGFEAISRTDVLQGQEDLFILAVLLQG